MNGQDSARAYAILGRMARDLDELTRVPGLHGRGRDMADMIGCGILDLAEHLKGEMHGVRFVRTLGELEAIAAEVSANRNGRPVQ